MPPTVKKAKRAPRVRTSARPRAVQLHRGKPLQHCKGFRGLAPRRWWALVRSPWALPVIFATRQQARENRDPDEYLVRVGVAPTRRADVPHQKGRR